MQVRNGAAHGARLLSNRAPRARVHLGSWRLLQKTHTGFCIREGARRAQSFVYQGAVRRRATERTTAARFQHQRLPVVESGFDQLQHMNLPVNNARRGNATTIG